MTEHGFAGEKLILKENNNKFFLERIILGSGRPVIEKSTNEIKIEISGNGEKIETVFYSNALKKSAKIEIRLNEKGIEILYDNVQSRISYIK